MRFSCQSSTPSGCASLVSVAVSATGDLDLNLLGVTEDEAATENGKLQGEEKYNRQFKQHLARQQMRGQNNPD